MKLLSRIVVFGWASLAMFVILAFTFPKPVSRLIHPVAAYIQVFPLAMFLLSFIYGISVGLREVLKQMKRN